MRPLRIGIAGGSLAGLFAAIVLQKDGHDVTVFERSARGLAGRGAGLVGQGDLFRMLRAIGCDHVARVGVVAKERIYFDGDGSVSERIAMPQTQISWDFLYSEVAAKLPLGSYVLGRAVQKVLEFPDKVVAVLDDGEEAQFDLLIGADGIGSVIRGVINLKATNAFAGYAAWRGLIPEGDLPAAGSVLLDRFAFFVTKGIHVLGYLVPGPAGETQPGTRRYNWVWYRPVSGQALQALFTGQSGRTYDFSLPRGELSQSRRKALIDDAFALLPPQFALAVDATPTPFIQGIYDYECNAMSSHRIALVGDAAFVVRPHTAMGVAKAAGDVLALRDALSNSNDLSEALEIYGSNRSAVGKKIAAYGRRLGETAL